MVKYLLTDYELHYWGNTNQLFSKGKWFNRKKIGYWERYHPNGDIKRKTFYIQ